MTLDQELANSSSSLFLFFLNKPKAKNVLRFLNNCIEEPQTAGSNCEHMQLVKSGILTVWSLVEKACQSLIQAKLCNDYVTIDFVLKVMGPTRGRLSGGRNGGCSTWRNV